MLLTPRNFTYYKACKFCFLPHFQINMHWVLCSTWAMTFWHLICVSLCSTPVTQSNSIQRPCHKPLVFLNSSVCSLCSNHPLLCPFISFCFACLTHLANPKDAWDGGTGRRLWDSLALQTGCFPTGTVLTGAFLGSMGYTLASKAFYHCISRHRLTHWDFMNWRTLMWYFWKIVRSATCSCWSPYQCNFQS